MLLRLTSAGQVASQALIVHEHLARVSRLRHRVLGCHFSTHNPESTKDI